MKKTEEKGRDGTGWDESRLKQLSAVNNREWEKKRQGKRGKPGAPTTFYGECEAQPKQAEAHLQQLLYTSCPVIALAARHQRAPIAYKKEEKAKGSPHDPVATSRGGATWRQLPGRRQLRALMSSNH